MEASRITDLLSSTYIPALPNSSAPVLPSHHPTLIVQDRQDDDRHLRSCGCSGNACIKEKAWFYRENGEIKKMSSFSIGHSDAVATQQLSQIPNGRQL